MWHKFADEYQGMPPSYPKGHRDVKPLTAEEKRLAVASDNRQYPILIPIPPWTDEAECRGLGGEGLGDLAFPRTKEAAGKFVRDYCRACPVREACLQYARDNDEQTGVWGGVLFGFNRPCVERKGAAVPWREVKASLKAQALFHSSPTKIMSAVADDLGMRLNAVERAVHRHGYDFAA